MYYEKVCVKDTNEEQYPTEQCGHGPISKITTVQERESPGRGSGFQFCGAIFLVILFFPLSLFFIIRTVPQFKRVLIFRNGKLHKNKAYGPGPILYLPCIDELKHVDLRIRGLPIPAQDIITRDALPAVADAVVFFRITNPLYAVMNIGNYNLAVEQTASFTLRTQVAARDLVDLLKNRCAVSQEMYECMKVLTKMWGVRIIRTEIKELRMPLQLQKTMAAEAESTRLTTAKVAMAQAEIDISRNLLRATCILQQNPMGLQVVNQNERAVVLRLGRVTKNSPIPPGLDFFIPCTDVVILIDTRLQSMDIEPQEILTYDSVSVTVTSTIFFSIKMPIYTAVNTRYYKHSIELMARSVLANTLGQYTVPTLLSNRDILGTQLQRDMCKVNLDWGLDVEKFLLKEMILPYEMQHSMQTEAEGIRLAKAKIVESEGEIRSAEVLHEASQIFMSYPEAMKLRYLQTLNTIASNKCSTIVFPFPITIFHDCNLTAAEIEKYGVDKIDCAAWLKKERCERAVIENMERMKKMQEEIARSQIESRLVRQRKDVRERVSEMLPTCAATKCPLPC